MFTESTAKNDGRFIVERTYEPDLNAMTAALEILLYGSTAPSSPVDAEADAASEKHLETKERR